MKSGEGEHVDNDVIDHKCDVCGYVMGECVDGDGDGICDVCNQKMPSSGSGSFLNKIDFLGFSDWLISFHEFMQTLDFLSVFRKISGFACYIFEGAKLIFVC